MTGSDAQACPFFGTELLPGHDVGVVLEPGDDDLVVFLNIAASPALGDQVDAFGRAAHEDDFARGGGIQEAARLFPRAFVGVGGPGRKIVGGAMNVGIFVRVEI